MAAIQNQVAASKGFVKVRAWSLCCRELWGANTVGNSRYGLWAGSRRARGCSLSSLNGLARWASPSRAPIHKRKSIYTLPFTRSHLTFSRSSKAVADGAVGFYCDHHVSARMSKFMYGVEYLREFDGADPEHVKRQDRLCELPSGPKLLLDAFDCILARSVRVKESTVFSRKYCTELTSLSTLSVFEVEIWCYRGGDAVPKWIIRNSGAFPLFRLRREVLMLAPRTDVFSTLCLVRADLSPLTASAQPKTGKSGKKFWTIVFSIEIHFGLTEFRARIKWVDKEVRNLRVCSWTATHGLFAIYRARRTSEFNTYANIFT
jgi:hypothetical protein